MKKVPPQIMETRVLTQSRLFTIEGVDLKFSNGVCSTYERLRSGAGAVMVIPFDGENFIFSREYCVGTEQYELGFTKGKIDSGETPEDCAKRELQEEIGLGCRKLTHLRTINFAPGFMSLIMHIYLAEDLFDSKLFTGDEPEEIIKEIISIGKATSLLNDPNSELRESRCIVGLMHALNVLNK